MTTVGQLETAIRDFIEECKNKVILSGRVYSVPMNIFATD